MGYDMDIDKEYVCTCSLEQKSLQEKVIRRITKEAYIYVLISFIFNVYLYRQFLDIHGIVNGGRVVAVSIYIDDIGR